MTELFEQVDAIDGVKVTSPYSPEGAHFNSPTAPSRSRSSRSPSATRPRHNELGDEIKELGEEVDVPG